LQNAGALPQGGAKSPKTGLLLFIWRALI